MRVHRVAVIVGFSFLVAASAGRALATDVTFRLVDQGGDSIPASRLDVLTAPGGSVGQGGTIELPEGTYAVQVFPGIGGVNQGGYLYRDEALSVSGPSQDATFVWHTAPLTAHVRDQQGAAIAASLVELLAIGIQSPAGEPIVLPVTVEPLVTDPTILGGYSDGYPWIVEPGMVGVAQGGYLNRAETAEELPTGGATREFVWKTASLELRILDQFDDPIPVSQIEMSPMPTEVIVPNLADVVLPVTEDPSAPPVEGILADGYPVLVEPGIDGVAQGFFLYRAEPAVELTTASGPRVFRWKTAEFASRVEDQFGVEIPGSQLELVAHPAVLPTGTSRTLPVSSDPSELPVTGFYSTGYAAVVVPGLAASPFGPVVHRTDSDRVLAVGTPIAPFVWETVTGTLTVVDESEGELPVASVDEVLLGTVPTGTTVTLLVNDFAVYPTLGGAFAGGYADFRVRPRACVDFEGPFTFTVGSGGAIDPPFAPGADYGIRIGAPSDHCLTGNVNAGGGAIVPVLSVNGAIGEVGVPVDSPIAISLGVAPAGPANAIYFLWIWLGCPSRPQPLVVQGHPLGHTANPTPFSGSTPQPFRCLRGAGVPPAACGASRELTPAPARAPWTLPKPGGLGNPLRLTLQGVIRDESATGSPFRVSVTNCVVVRIGES